MSAELRACPFCGSPGKVSKLDHLIGCSNPECFVPWSFVTEFEWNQRPIEDALRARIAELEREVDRLFETCDAVEKFTLSLPEYNDGALCDIEVIEDINKRLREQINDNTLQFERIAELEAKLKEIVERPPKNNLDAQELKLIARRTQERLE